MTTARNERRASGVAVVIPAYRAERWVGAAVASAFAQTLPPDEVVVVDDGSPGDLEAALAPWRGRVLYARQRNAGPAAARNTGVRLTTAPLLAFLDADDLWEPGKLAAQVAVLGREHDSVMVCSDAWEFGEGREPRRKNGTRAVDLSLPGLFADNRIWTLTAVVRRSAFDAVGGFDEDPRLVAVEDYDLWLRLAERGRIAYVDQPLARYRTTAQSLSGPRRFLEGVTRVLDRAVRRLPPGSELRTLVSRRKAGLYRDLAWGLLEDGQARRALEPILEALAHSPADPASWRLLARALFGRMPFLERIRRRAAAPARA